MAVEGSAVGVLAGGRRGFVKQVAIGERGRLELGVRLAQMEALHRLAGAAIRAGAVGDLGLLLDPPVRQQRVIADEAGQFGARLRLQ